MNTRTPQPELLIACMESLADATRLRLLAMLAEHELGVAELCQVMQMPQSTVSRHLKVLANEGWTVSRRNGTANLYRMVVDELPEPGRSLWQVAGDQIASQPTFEQDRLRLKRVLDKREHDAESFFSGAAGEWAQLRADLYGATFTDAAMRALLPADWVVADLGCGTGDVALQLAQHVKQVIAVDNTPAMLKTARARAAKFGNVDIRKGDMLALPIEDDTCDAALMLLVLTYIDDAPAAVAELARILKPGGRAVVMDLLRHDRDDFRRQMGQVCLGFQRQQFKRMLSDAGLVSVKVEALPPEPHARGPALVMAVGMKKATK
jgi:ArsR family transcriptional regulator